MKKKKKYKAKKKKVFVSDNPTESKKFRRLNEIFLKFLKKKIYLGNFRLCDGPDEIQDGGSARHGASPTFYHDIFLWKSTYLRKKKWILTIERRLIVFNPILVENRSFVDRTRVWKVSYTISKIDFVIGRDNGPTEK